MYASLACGVLLLAATACEASPSVAENNADELWLVTTRHLTVPEECHGELSRNLRVSICRDGRFQPTPIEEFYAGDDPFRLTVIYLPGNRSGRSYAIQRGMRLYSNMQATRPGDRPIRMVIWDWPNDKIRGPLRDVRVKGERTKSEAFYLSAFLNRMSPEQQASLIGYSFGSQIALGALHLSNGGSIDGKSLVVHNSETGEAELEVQRRIRVALLAAAANVGSLNPQGDFSQSVQSIDKLLLFYNPNDPILCRYHLVDGQSALGCNGLYLQGSSLQQMVTLMNAGGPVGRSHSEDRYYNSSTLMQAICDHTWWNTER